MPAVELAPVGETVPAAELAPAAALLPAAAASDDSAIAVPHVAAVKMVRFECNDGIELRVWSAPAYPRYDMSTPNACLLHTSTCCRKQQQPRGCHADQSVERRGTFLLNLRGHL